MPGTKIISSDQPVTVCLALGPYRNLSTLTASILFLHPNCQVLNHAGIRIFGNNETDFLVDYEDSKFESFINYAIQASMTGKQGEYGGSITFSHAFDEKFGLNEIFKNSGEKLLKQDIKCLFWKESLLTAQHIRNNKVDLDYILSKNNQLKFLLPIRNPINCAISNFKPKHRNRYGMVKKNASLEDTLLAILDEIFWVQQLKTKFPDRFFVYYEHTFNRKILIKMAAFLNLEPDPIWIKNALDAFKVINNYQIDSDFMLFYRQSVTEKFEDYPHCAKQLMLFLEN